MGRLEFSENVVRGWARLRPGADVRALALIQKLIWSGRLAEVVLERAAISVGLRRRGDYEVLALLRRIEPDQPTPAELAQHLMTSPSGMTGKIDRLEGQGLLEREPDSYDRRAVKLRLTNRGRTLTDKAFDRALELYWQMLDALTKDEISTLDGHLSELLGKLESLERLDEPWNA